MFEAIIRRTRITLLSIVVLLSMIYQSDAADSWISGKVTTSTGQPIANVHVDAFGIFDNVYYGGGGTDQNGSYSITLLPGSYRIHTNASGHTPERYIEEYWDDGEGTLDSDKAKPVTTVAGQTVPNINFFLTEGGVISRKVTNSSGQAITSVCVDASNSSDWIRYGGGGSDQNGNYSIVLPAGSYYIHTNTECHQPEKYIPEFWDGGDGTIFSNKAKPVSVVLKQVTPNINFSLGEGAVISGKVTNSSGQPIDNVHVDAFGISDNIYYGGGGTGQDGNYTIALPAGTYSIHTNTSGHNPERYVNEIYDGSEGTLDSTKAKPVTAIAGQTTPNINFSLSEGGVISGKVTNSSGQPIANICVDAYNSSDGVRYGGGGSDQDGNYSIVLPTGSYFIHTNTSCHSPEDYIPEWWDNTYNDNQAAPVTVVFKKTTPNINFSLIEGGSVSGRITDEKTGQPVAGASVGKINLNIGWHKFVYRHEEITGAQASRAAFKKPGYTDWKIFSTAELTVKTSLDSGAQNGIVLLNKKNTWTYHPQNHGKLIKCVDNDASQDTGWYGRSIVAALNQSENIHGNDDNFTSYYEAYFYADIAGDWYFSTDSDDASEIVIDDQLIAYWYLGHPSANRWEHQYIAELRGETGEWLQGTSGNPDGTYTFTKLLPGNYIVGAISAGYVGELYEDTHYYDKSTLITVNASERIENINLALQPGFPIDGAIMNVHESDGSFRHYVEVYISEEFNGILPDDINSVTVTGPTGEILHTKADMPYYSSFREFITYVPGSPQIGEYTFTVVSGDTTVTVKDVQTENKTILLPDKSTFSPASGAVVDSLTPTFTWQSVTCPDTACYYRFRIRDSQGNILYSTTRNQNMLSHTVPKGVLSPGMSYQWRVEVMDNSYWIDVQNRSNSEWVTFTTEPAEPGDLNNSGTVDLGDVIIALKILSGINVGNIPASAHVNSEKIGLEEAVFILQKVAGLR